MKIITNKIITTIILFLASGLATGYAQKNERNFGASLASQITGNATGLTYSPSLYFECNKNLFHAGINFQSNSTKSTGFNAGIQRTFVHQSESFSGKTSLYSFSDFIYQHNAVLGSAGQSKVKHFSPEYNDVNKINYCIGELYVGAGIKRHLTNQSSFDLSMGLGGYKTIKTSAPTEIPEGYKLTRNEHDLSLIIKLKYTFQFNKNLF